MPSLWVKHAVVTLLSSSHHFLDVKSEKPDGIKGSSTFVYGGSCPFSYVSHWFVPDCFLGHPYRVYKIKLDKRNLPQFGQRGGITDLMVKFIQSVHLKSQVINPDFVSEEKEYVADEFIRVTFPDMSAREAARLVAICRGDNLEPRLRAILQQNVVALKMELGVLGKRRDIEFSVIVDKQDLNANFQVQQGVSKRRRDVCDQSSLNLTGPHGEAR